jgi:hypothetical protein
MIRLQPNGREVLAGGTTIALPFTISEAWWDSNRGNVVALMAFHENTSTKRFENLVAYNVAGQMVWQAELPAGSGADAYTAAEVREDTISAFSFSGYRCTLDSVSGRIVSTLFAK